MVTNYKEGGGGFKTGGGGRQVRFNPYEKGGGGEKVLAMLKGGGGRKSFGVVFLRKL